MSDPELESFKSNIDLRVYAQDQGYVLDRKSSWRGSSVMRHSDGDKIVIKRGLDGHYVYFSIHRDGDTGGSIIDFVQNRNRASLGAVRKELRPWVGKAAAVTAQFPALPKTSKDRLRVETEYARTQEALSHPYLEKERALPAVLLAQDRFAGRVRIDARGNAIFPHFDVEGLCGFEIKNASFTSFSSGGTKGLWFSHTLPDDNRLVFSESAIDSLSYAVLFPEEHTRYASIGGQVSVWQPELIRAAAARMPAGSEIVAAMDADADGAKLAAIVGKSVELSGRSDLRFVVNEPFGFKDWNDQLRKAQPSSFPTAQTSFPDVR